MVPYIYIRTIYFLYADGEFTVEYCNTLAMLADYFTKPLQGELFRRLRRVIMGWDPIEILQTFIIPTDKERVGNSMSEVITKNGKTTYRDALLTNVLRDASPAEERDKQ
jgi:hypothetical protein